MASQEPIYAFDWQRLLWGQHPLGFYAEIAFRTLVMYLALLFMLRLLSKRTLSQLSILEFGIVIALGSAAGDPTFYADVPLGHGLLVLFCVVAIQRVYTWLLRKNEAVETLMEGRPVELIQDGRILLDQLERARLSQEELFEMLRLKDVSQLGEICRAYMEQNGQISVFKHRHPLRGLPIAPPWDLAEHQAQQAGRIFDEPQHLACCNCGFSDSYYGVLPKCPQCQSENYLAAQVDPLELDPHD